MARHFKDFDTNMEKKKQKNLTDFGKVKIGTKEIDVLK